VGLDFAELFGAEHAETFEAVLRSPVEEAGEAVDFFLCGGDDYFSADVVGDGMTPAEFDHLANASDCEAGSGGAGLVVETAVEDSAVVAALMLGYFRLFFQDGDLGVGEAFQEAVGGGEAYYAATDYCDTEGHLVILRAPSVQ
jgi:hypothetical protein